MFGKDRIHSPALGRMAIALAVVIGLGCPSLAFAFEFVADDLEKGASAPPRPEPPIPIFVNALTDLSAILKRFDQPDFVILRGDEYHRLINKDKGSAAVSPRLPAIVESISAAGNLKDEVIEFLIDFVIAKESDGPTWVPLRLDGLILSGAKEEGRDLPLRVSKDVWEVELSTKGRHLVKVRLFLKVRQSAEGNRVEFAIPEAAATRLLLEVPRRVTEARAGPGELLTKEYLPTTARTRLSADLVPRSRLGVLWISEEEAVAQLPPLLVTQAEMAMDIDLGSIHVSTSWAIRSARGVAKTLEILLNPDDEVLELELDGQSPPAGIERAKDATRLLIPLTDPLIPGRERKLALKTRRPIASQNLANVIFKGYPITNAREQSGVIGIVQSVNLGVSALPGRGVRQIDPATELPVSLRFRPSTTLAFQFSEQPFELNLRIEPSLPLVRSESRTTITLQPDIASIDTWLDFQAARGRLFEVNLSVPASLKIESIGPEDVVQTWQAGSLPSSLTSGGPSGGVQLLTVKLAGKIQEGGRFSIQVRGKRAIEHLGRVEIGFVEPVGTISGGGRVVVLTPPSLTAELDTPQGSAAHPSLFRAAAQAPPADWPWPSGKAPQTAPTLWLRHDLNPSELPLTVAFHPKTLLESTTLNVRVGYQTIDVLQETECQARFGAYESLDVLVPKAIEEGWLVEGAELDPQSLNGPSPGEARLTRLKLFSELNRSTRLRFHYQIPITNKSRGQESFDLRIPMIRIAGSSSGLKAPTAKLRCDPGYEVESVDSAWSIEQGDSESPLDSPNQVDLSLASRQWETQALDLKIHRRHLATLPSLVISRHLLQTVKDPKGKLFQRASYWVERHEGSLSVHLPAQSVLSLARVAHEPISQVEQLSERRGLRIRFPSKVGRDPVLVELEYSNAGDSATGSWSAPEVLNGAVIQQSYWEVSIPWNQAVVGTPSGWVDENEWYWDNYVWRRRPRFSSGELTAWVGGGGGALPVSAPQPAGSAVHRYLFGFAGAPASLELTSASRALLVGICSGTILVIGGLLIVVWHPSARLAMCAVATALFATATFLDPNVFLLALQSGIVGLILVLLLTVMKRVVERRNPEALPRDQSSLASASVMIPVGSTVSRTVGVGSEDSTAIRPRQAEIAEPSSNHAITADTKAPQPREDDVTRRTIRTLG